MVLPLCKLNNLWPFQGLRPLSLHNAMPLGHYLYSKCDLDYTDESLKEHI